MKYKVKLGGSAWVALASVTPSSLHLEGEHLIFGLKFPLNVVETEICFVLALQNFGLEDKLLRIELGQVKSSLVDVLCWCLRMILERCLMQCPTKSTATCSFLSLPASISFSFSMSPTYLTY